MMPLYEGIALIQEKQAVVLDLGTDYTKFGFTGEASPRCIIRSEFWCPTERRMKRVHDYKTAEELYENLVHMLHLLYFRHVLVNPKERKVVVVESLLTPTLFRETLAKVLFLHYEVGGAVWADAARLSALTLGTAHALVVAVGARDAEVAAVVHACPVLRAVQSAPLAARALHEELATELERDNGVALALPDHVLEDIKVKTLFVSSRSRSLLWDGDSPPAPAKSVKYPLPDRTAITVSGTTRERVAEVLFARDNEMTSLGDIVLQCIMQCPIDSRRPLAENILVTGGTANLPGFKARLADELRYLVTQPPYCERLHTSVFKFHSPPAAPATCAWSGAAALAAGDAVTSRALSRDAYARDRRLPDWVNLLDNTPPHKRYYDQLYLGMKVPRPPISMPIRPCPATAVPVTSHTPPEEPPKSIVPESPKTTAVTSLQPLDAVKLEDIEKSASPEVLKGGKESPEKMKRGSNLSQDARVTSSSSVTKCAVGCVAKFVDSFLNNC